MNIFATPTHAAHDAQT